MLYGMLYILFLALIGAQGVTISAVCLFVRPSDEVV